MVIIVPSHKDMEKAGEELADSGGCGCLFFLGLIAVCAIILMLC